MMRSFGRASLLLGRTRGIPIRVHLSLLVALPFVAGASTSYFTSYANSMGAQGMLLPPLAWGLVVALGLIGSVAVHEAAHAGMAGLKRASVTEITLWFFGGTNELKEVPSRCRDEAVIAAAGPLANLSFGLLLFGIQAASVRLVTLDVTMALGLLTAMNVVLGLLNLVPAFPLDGGRILRALLAQRIGRARATHVAAGLGKVASLALGLLALWELDIFLMLVAGVVYLAADREASAAEIDETLEGVRVGDVMSVPRLVLGATLTIGAAAEEMLKARTEIAAITAPGLSARALGAVTAAELRRIAPEAGQSLTLGEVVAGKDITVAPGEPLRSLLKSFVDRGLGAVAVVDEEGRLLGVLEEKDLEREMSLRRLAMAIPTPKRT